MCLCILPRSATISSEHIPKCALTHLLPCNLSHIDQAATFASSIGKDFGMMCKHRESCSGYDVWSTDWRLWSIANPAGVWLIVLLHNLRTEKSQRANILFSLHQIIDFHGNSVFVCVCPFWLYLLLWLMREKTSRPKHTHTHLQTDCMKVIDWSLIFQPQSHNPDVCPQADQAWRPTAEDCPDVGALLFPRLRGDRHDVARATAHQRPDATPTKKTLTNVYFKFSIQRWLSDQ